MYFLKAVLILLWFAVVPYFVGLLFTGRMKENRDSFLLALLCGYGGMFALFEIMALPMIFARFPFHILKYAYGMVMLAVAVFSLVVNRKRLGQTTVDRLRRAKHLPWPCVLALVLIGIQVGIYVVGMATDLDDAFYVATAGTTIETDTMFRYNAYMGNLLKEMPSRYVLSPFPIMLAFYGEAVQMHPTIVAHTIMPVFFVALAYAVYALLGQKLFRGDTRSTGMFLCFLSLIHIFSYYSVYTQGTFMLIRIWQGKAVLAALLLPLLFYMSLKVLTEEASFSEWLALLAVMTACCLVSSMGIMLAPIMLGILTIVLALSKKQWKKTGIAALCCLPNLVCAGIYILIR